MTSSLAACAANMPTRLPGSPPGSVPFAALPTLSEATGSAGQRPRLASFCKVGCRASAAKELFSYYNH